MNELVFDLAWVAAVIGFFLPLLISLVKRATWPTSLKRAVALTVSAIAGVVNTGVQAGWSFTDAGEFLSLAVLSIIDVYVVASVVYANFWKDTEVERSLEAVGS